MHPQLSHLRVALLADWSHSIKGTPMPEFLARVRETGADGLLVHGLPPRVRGAYYEAARAVGQPIVTTCYSSSQPSVLDEAAQHGSAYIYLVAHYGRSGTVGPPDHTTLVPVLKTLRDQTDVPIAVGFGVKNRTHTSKAWGTSGRTAAIVGAPGSRASHAPQPRTRGDRGLPCLSSSGAAPGRSRAIMAPSTNRRRKGIECLSASCRT